MAERQDWHTDKRVTLSVITTLLLYGFLTAWWASEVSSDLEVIKEALNDNEQENLRQWARINSNEEALAEALGYLRTNNAILERLEKRFDRLEQRSEQGRVRTDFPR